MFRVPKWSIVAFVFLAVVTAFFVNHFVGAGKIHKGEFASKMLETSEYENPTVQVAQVSQKLQNLAKASFPDGDHCQCTVEGKGSPDFELETPKQCGPHRVMYEAAFLKMPAVFREERAKNDADFPKACIVYIMNKFLGNSGEKRPVSYFATCKSPKSMPVRSGYRPCITANYVNEIYNTFTDMTSCLGMPQRDYLPKLYRESGFHLNAIGSAYDAGISQMTGDAISFANKRFKEFQTKIANSDVAACQRIAPYVKKFAKASEKKELRCELISPADNPLLNLFYMGIKYRQDVDGLANYMALPQFDIINRMSKLGLTPDKYSREQLTQIMVILGFNAGINGAVINLSNYLKSVEASHRKLTLDDFNFQKESLLYSKLDDENMSMVRHERDTADRWKTRMREFEKEMKIAQEKNPRYKPKIEKITLKSPRWGNYSTYHLVVKHSELSFPAYLQLHQATGTAGYASFVSRAGDELDSVFKEGTCVPNSYLSL